MINSQRLCAVFKTTVKRMTFECKEFLVVVLNSFPSQTANYFLTYRFSQTQFSVGSLRKLTVHQLCLW